MTYRGAFKRQCRSLCTATTMLLLLCTAGSRAGASGDPPFTLRQAERARPVYLENCASCHGGDLSGTLMAPSLKGPGFLDRWSRQSLMELFDYMRLFMPLHSPGGLSKGQNADLLAFLLQSNGFTAGDAELPSDPTALSGFTLGRVAQR